MSTKWKKHCDFTDRSCDALVLACSPNEPIGKAFGMGFYIPTSVTVEEALGYSLRKILGTKKGASCWYDAVRWDTIANLTKLEEKILEGTRKAICGPSDYATIFDQYLSSSERFEHTWIFMKGDVYRFKEGKRKEALQEFHRFWNEKETDRWMQIHKLMREYIRKEFSKKH